MESGQLATSDFAPRTNRDTARDEATAVIASEAKQSSFVADVAMDCFAALAMTMDGQRASLHRPTASVGAV